MKDIMFIIGDCAQDSDVGKFCQRIEKESDSRIVYIDSLHTKNLETLITQDIKRINPKAIITNIVNNRYLFANLLTSQRIYNAFINKKSINRHKIKRIGIVHDCIIDYPAQISSLAITGLNTNLIDELKFVGGINTINKILKKDLPGFMRGTYVSMDKTERGKLALGMITKEMDLLICHSNYAKKIISFSLNKTGSTKNIETIPLAYDMIKTKASSGLSDNTQTSLKELEGGESLSIGIFGMFFNRAKSLEKLKQIIYSSSKTQKVHVWVAGKINVDILDFISNVKKLCGAETINHLGFVSDNELCRLIKLTDYIWCYRYPTHGESSGTVLRSLSMGSCPIIVNEGWYAEIPSNLVLRLKNTDSANKIAKLLIKSKDNLRFNRTKRIDYVANFHSPKSYAHQLADMCKKANKLHNEEVNINIGIESLWKNIFASSFYTLTDEELVLAEATNMDMSKLVKDISQLFEDQSREAGFRIPTELVIAPARKIRSVLPEYPHRYTTRAEYLYWINQNCKVSEFDLGSIYSVQCKITREKPMATNNIAIEFCKELLNKKISKTRPAAENIRSIKQLALLFILESIAYSLNEKSTDGNKVHSIGNGIRLMPMIYIALLNWVNNLPYLSKEKASLVDYIETCYNIASSTTLFLYIH